MCVMGRLAESEEPVLFARFGDVDKCEFLKINAPVDASTFTDDGAGLLVKTGGLREQAREVLVSAVRSITSHSQPRALTLHLPQLSLRVVAQPPTLLRGKACSLWRKGSLRRRSRKSRRITTAARRRHCSRVTHYASTACL